MHCMHNAEYKSLKGYRARRVVIYCDTRKSSLTLNNLHLCSLFNCIIKDVLTRLYAFCMGVLARQVKVQLREKQKE